MEDTTINTLPLMHMIKTTPIHIQTLPNNINSINIKKLAHLHMPHKNNHIAVYILMYSIGEALRLPQEIEKQAKRTIIMTKKISDRKSTREIPIKININNIW